MSVKWNLEEALSMRAAGATWGQVGEHFGISGDMAHIRSDPEYRRRRLERNHINRKGYYLSPAKGFLYSDRKEERNPILPPERDNRTLTAFICGDPYPERSALALRTTQSNEVRG